MTDKRGKRIAVSRPFDVELQNEYIYPGREFHEETA